jgi:hypothetical protein
VFPNAKIRRANGSIAPGAPLQSTTFAGFLMIKTENPASAAGFSAAC